MLAVAIGWELYERTHSAMALGFVGLVQVAPIYFLVLPAGHAADRFDRRMVAMLSLALLIATSLGLAAISYTQAPVALVYVCLFFVGVALAFHRPAAAALLPQLVPPEDFTNAVTWSSTGLAGGERRRPRARRRVDRARAPRRPRVSRRRRAHDLLHGVHRPGPEPLGAARHRAGDREEPARRRAVRAPGAR